MGDESEGEPHFRTGGGVRTEWQWVCMAGKNILEGTLGESVVGVAERNMQNICCNTGAVLCWRGVQGICDNDGRIESGS